MDAIFKAGVVDNKGSNKILFSLDLSVIDLSTAAWLRIDQIPVTFKSAHGLHSTPSSHSSPERGRHGTRWRVGSRHGLGGGSDALLEVCMRQCMLDTLR